MENMIKTNGEHREVLLKVVESFENFDVAEVYSIDTRTFLYRTCINRHGQAVGHVPSLKKQKVVNNPRPKSKA